MMVSPTMRLARFATDYNLEHGNGPHIEIFSVLEDSDVDEVIQMINADPERAENCMFAFSHGKWFTCYKPEKENT